MMTYMLQSIFLISIFQICSCVDSLYSFNDTKIHQHCSSKQVFISNYVDIQIYNWTSVTRVSSGYAEGYSFGWPGNEINNNKFLLPWGCFFAGDKVSGSYRDDDQHKDMYSFGGYYYRRIDQIYINQGKVLFWTKKLLELTKYLNLQPDGCLPNTTSGGGSICDDKYYCSRLLPLGYDSIFCLHDNEASQVIICKEYCSTEPLTTACPFMELRKGFQPDINNLRYTKTCFCSDTANSFLNCLSYMMNIGTLCDRITYGLPNVLQVQVNKSFDLTILFTTNLLSTASIELNNKVHYHSRIVNNTILLLNYETLQNLLINRISLDHFITNNIRSGIDYKFIGNEKNFTKVLNDRNMNISQIIKRKYDYIPNTNHSYINKHNTLYFYTNTNEFDIPSTILYIDNIAIGIIIYNITIVISKLASMKEMARWIVDESLCLHRLGADIIIVMGEGDYVTNKYIYHYAKDHITLILSINDIYKDSNNNSSNNNNNNNTSMRYKDHMNNMEDINCQGLWYSSNTTRIIQLSNIDTNIVKIHIHSVLDELSIISDVM